MISASYSEGASAEVYVVAFVEDFYQASCYVAALDLLAFFQE